MAPDLFPSPGLLVDRKTILILKIEAVEATGRDAGKLGNERREVEQKVEDALVDQGLALRGVVLTPNSRKSIKDAEDSLLLVNRRLWRAEDEVRSLPDADRRRLAELAKLIATLNDYRADQIAKINIVLRCVVEPKVYR